MVTSPPPSPTKHQTKEYPLFSKLLLEGLNSRRNSNLGPRLTCPATAPVLNTESTKSVVQFPDCSDTKMADPEIHGHGVHAEGQKDEEEEIRPIRLQDPPKSKLKRQLSVNTRDSHESLRVHKKPNLGHQDNINDEQENSTSWKRVPYQLVNDDTDEVDGTGPAIVKQQQPTPENIQIKQQHVDVRRQDPTTRLNMSPSKHYYMRETQTSGNNGGNVPLTAKGQGYPDIPVSPNLFDLNDIGLTSPFMNTTPRSANKTKQVFVYPESSSTRPKKLSPYKQPNPVGQFPPDYQHDRTRQTSIETHPSDVIYRSNENLARDMFSDEIKRQTTLTAQTVDTQSGTSTEGHSGPKYVTAKGFDWSLNVTITQAIPFSPRVVTAEARPRYSNTTNASFSSSFSSPRHQTRSDSYEEDMAKLQRLEREYKRALEFFGCPEALKTQVLRSMSAVDKSPNEKSLRETREDVRNKYERMFSYPIAVPRISHYVSQQPQREDTRMTGHNDQDIRYQQNRPWLSDARRRLFARSESFYSQDQRNSPFEQESTHSSADIPEEVLQFLHSKNFHPEELENLKDFLRRGGSGPQEHHGPSYLRSSPLQHDPEVDVHAFNKYDMDLEYRRNLTFDPVYGPVRERRRGDIDVRLSCDSIVPSKSTQEMLADLEHDSTDCRCSKIEEAIRQMALQAYSKIRRTDTSPASFTQFQNEINETNIHVYDSMQFLCGVKCLCKYGRTLEEVYSGSVVFRLNCPNIDALTDLWQSYRSGALLKELQNGFVTDELKTRFRCETIRLKVVVSKEDYYTCKAELEAVLRSQIGASPKKSPGATIFHARSRSEPASVSKQANQMLTPKKKLLSPFRERFCSDSSVELSPRRAFQEINVSKDAMPLCSPSSRKQDNVFFSDESPLTSPKRHQFPSTSPQGEQENVGQSGSMLQSPRQTNFPELPWSDSRNEPVSHV